MKQLRSTLLPFLLIFFAFRVLSQDTLVFENKWKFPIQILEERDDEVIYKKPGLVHSPTYIIEKRFVTGVQYKEPETRAFKYKSSPVVKKRPLEVWVTPSNSPVKTQGLLFALNDTMMVVRERANVFDGRQGSIIKNFHYNNIYLIEVRERHRISKMSLWSSLGGLGLGTLTGLIFFKNDPVCDTSIVDGRPCDETLKTPHTKFEKAIKLGIGTAVAGFIGGTFIGSVKVEFAIGGKKDSFNRSIPKLRRLSRTQNAWYY
jgi:hypothetical protein